MQTETNDLFDMSDKKISNNSRLIVIQTLLKVQQGLSLSALLDPLLNKVNPKDKSFIHALLLTTLRHWHATGRLMDSLAKQPIDELEVRTTIQVGITQILYLEVADHACIFETVEAVKKLGLNHASGLVNAILRKVSSNPAKFRKRCNKKHSLPNWLAMQLKQDWSDVYDDLTASLRHSAPMYLRVNARQTDSNAYQNLLTEADIFSEIDVLQTQLTINDQQLNSTTEAIRLLQSTSVASLPNFDTGMASVQDVHAMIAGGLMSQLTKYMQESTANDASKPLHILDACTAPSGKLAHCLELFSRDDIITVAPVKVGVDGDNNDKYVRQHIIADDTAETTKSKLALTAIDNDHIRLLRSEQTLERIGLTDEAKLVCGDAVRWQASRTDPEQFDLILLDAPCTATGVLRRHPDIGLLRHEEDVEATVELQSQILDNLWQQLKPNGCLIYATCSLFKAENSEQMQNFIERHNSKDETDTADNAYSVQEVKLSDEACNWGIEQVVGRQCLPLDVEGGDGFYYAIVQKVAKSLAVAK